MEITFQEYTDKDRDILLGLIVELEEYAKSIDPIKRVRNLSGFAEYSLDEHLKNVQKFEGRIWLAMDANKAIGYIIGVIWKQSKKNRLEIGRHKVGEVIDLYLKENYRGKGIGRKMLKMMEDYFKDNGCDSIWIEVFEPNKKALAVYEKFGFVKREIGMLKEI